MNSHPFVLNHCLINATRSLEIPANVTLFLQLYQLYHASLFYRGHKPCSLTKCIYVTFIGKQTPTGWRLKGCRRCIMMILVVTNVSQGSQCIGNMYFAKKLQNVFHPIWTGNTGIITMELANCRFSILFYLKMNGLFLLFCTLQTLADLNNWHFWPCCCRRWWSPDSA